MDFLVTPRKIYLLEVDALPALDDNSPLTRILDGIGAPIDHVILEMLKRKGI
jgi:hypothetical protein